MSSKDPSPMEAMQPSINAASSIQFDAGVVLFFIPCEAPTTPHVLKVSSELGARQRAVIICGGTEKNTVFPKHSKCAFYWKIR